MAMKQVLGTTVGAVVGGAGLTAASVALLGDDLGSSLNELKELITGTDAIEQGLQDSLIDGIESASTTIAEANTTVEEGSREVFGNAHSTLEQAATDVFGQDLDGAPESVRNAINETLNALNNAAQGEGLGIADIAAGGVGALGGGVLGYNVTKDREPEQQPAASTQWRDRIAAQRAAMAQSYSRT
jgi:hypothetical protein